MLKRLIILALFSLCCFGANAEVVYLNNGDRVSGEIVEENKDKIILNSELLGEVSFTRDSVKKIKKNKEPKETNESTRSFPLKWKKEISVGYTQNEGNTDSRNLNLSFLFNRKTGKDETTFKGRFFYSSSAGQMDAQQWYQSSRYAFSFGRRKKWYNAYELEVDHDRFASINYRIIPSVAVGFWFSDTEVYRLMSELGLGFSHTDFRGSKGDKNKLILTPRVFLEKQLAPRLTFTQGFSIYPVLDDFNSYRFHSETALVNKINGNLALKISLIDDYDSQPAVNAQKNDLRLISSLMYSF
jgi:putative salt-induced outer membrane protein YdiY